MFGSPSSSVLSARCSQVAHPLAHHMKMQKTSKNTGAAREKLFTGTGPYSSLKQQIIRGRMHRAHDSGQNDDFNPPMPMTQLQQKGPGAVPGQSLTGSKAPGSANERLSELTTNQKAQARIKPHGPAPHTKVTRIIRMRVWWCEVGLGPGKMGRLGAKAISHESGQRQGTATPERKRIEALGTRATRFCDDDVPALTHTRRTLPWGSPGDEAVRL